MGKTEKIIRKISGTVDFRNRCAKTPGLAAILALITAAFDVPFGRSDGPIRCQPSYNVS